MATKRFRAPNLTVTADTNRDTEADPAEQWAEIRIQYGNARLVLSEAAARDLSRTIKTALDFAEAPP